MIRQTVLVGVALIVALAILAPGTSAEVKGTGSYKGIGNKPLLQSGTCGTCGPSGTLCNAWGELPPSLSPLGIRSRVGVADPTIRDGKWSFMRVALAGVPTGGGWHLMESGWLKDPCFVTPGCSRYGVWKNATRHFIVIQNYNGYSNWDVSNTSPGWTHEYRVEKDANGPGHLAYIDNNLAASAWLDFMQPVLTIGGGEVVNPPNNGMGTSTFSLVKYKDSSYQWQNVGSNYNLVVTASSTSYQAIANGSNSWIIRGCN